MSKFKVVITDYEFENLNIEENVLSQLNVEFIKNGFQTEDELIELVKDADAIINQYAPISERVIKEMKKCKVISRYGVGVDTVDIDVATSEGIYVCNVPDYGIEEVSNHALSLLLSLSRKIVQLNNYVKKGEWDFKLGFPIRRSSHQTLGVYGFGQIPRSLVKKASVLGFNILAHDPFVTDEEIKKGGAEPVSLQDLFKKSDFISVHVPLTETTKHVIDYEKFKLMKDSAVIINTARGSIINEKDLVRALEEGVVAGAALDVLEVEPVEKNNPLLKFDNVILTPHSAWYSEESMVELRTKTVQNIVEVLEGKVPKYLVNTKVQDVIPRKTIVSNV